MKSRFFGASSYDDDDDDEEMDLSGFVTSSETQPIVVERKRAPRSPPEPAQMFGSATSPDNMSNAGAKTMPEPPMSNVGYYSRAEVDGDPSTGNWYSHFNPLYTSDSMNPKYRNPVVLSKSIGAPVALMGALTAGLSPKYRTVGKSMMTIGSAMYIHPIVGIKHGIVKDYVGKPAPFVTPMSSIMINGAGALGFYQLLAATTPLPPFAGIKTQLGVTVVLAGALASVRRYATF